MSLKNKITGYLLDSKVRPVLYRLSQTLNFPAKASVIKKVLVVMPRNMSLLEDANRFIQSLRKSYPNWRVELFDVDKLSEKDLNRMSLPRDEIVDKLRNAKYNFVMDLNDQPDQLSAYVALMTEAPYRLHLNADESDFFNLTFQPQTNGDGSSPRKESEFYNSLLEYLGKLFVN